MKKSLLCFISAVILLTSSACASVPDSVPEEAFNETEAAASEPPVVHPDALNSADYILDLKPTPIYEHGEIRHENPGDGMPLNYEELQDYMESYDYVSLVGYEIISQYSPEEAAEITGKDYYKTETALYKIHIYYDYLNDVPLDITVNLAKSGLHQGRGQVKNDPPYSAGQKLISSLIGLENEDSCVAIGELNFYVYNVNGTELAYHLGNEHIAFRDDTLPNLNMELFPEECSVVTSTADNPVIFTQKSTAEDLAEFFRRDWTARGYTFYSEPH